MRNQHTNDGSWEFVRALDALEAGEYELACAYFKHSLELAPAQRHGLINSMLAKTTFLRPDWDAAIQEATAVLRLDPESELALALRGTAHASLGRCREAICDFSELLKVNPVDARAYLERGRLHLRLRHHLLALADFNHALRLDPKLEGLHVCRSEVYCALCHWAAAIKEATEAITQGDCPAVAYYVRAVCRQERGEHDRAVEDLTRVIELVPHATALVTRAASYRELGEEERAAADERAAAELAHLDNTAAPAHESAPLVATAAPSPDRGGSPELGSVISGAHSRPLTTHHSTPSNEQART